MPPSRLKKPPTTVTVACPECGEEVSCETERFWPFGSFVCDRCGRPWQVSMTKRGTRVIVQRDYQRYGLKPLSMADLEDALLAIPRSRPRDPAEPVVVPPGWGVDTFSFMVDCGDNKWSAILHPKLVEAMNYALYQRERTPSGGEEALQGGTENLHGGVQ